jgi:hypothetical protein
LQNSAPIRGQFDEHAFRFGVDLILPSGPKYYVNAKPFLGYISIVYLPYLPELRTLDEFAEEVAVLWMDN